MKSAEELDKENKSLKRKLREAKKVLTRVKDYMEKESKKEICYHCNGSGEYWTYWDGDIHCPYCHGSGRL